MVPLLTSETSARSAGLDKAEKLRRTLLIVDDEDGPRQSLRLIFKDEYRLLLAENAATALDLIKKNTIDVAILDIRMVGMSGIELLEKLKELDPGIQVVMLTAYETIDTIRQALRLGACDYLNKPFDINTMRAAVGNAMERRSLDDEIRANNRKLEELQSELQNQKLQEEIIRTRGEIYASVIHDINGPLTIISGFIQVINQRIGDATYLEGDSLDLIKDRLKRITRQVTNCIEISRRYLSFLRQNPAEVTRVGVNQILADLTELLKVHPSAQKNQLSIQPMPEDVWVRINGTDLIQILLNLTINALQCTETAHQVRVHARLLPRSVDVADLEEVPDSRVVIRDAARLAPCSLGLTVEDNGPGMPPEILSKLFQPYFTTKPHPHGTGIGLTIVKRLVGEANGVIQVQSRPGEGSVFTIFLPATPLSND